MGVTAFRQDLAGMIPWLEEQISEGCDGAICIVLGHDGSVSTYASDMGSTAQLVGALELNKIRAVLGWMDDEDVDA